MENKTGNKPHYNRSRRRRYNRFRQFHSPQHQQPGDNKSENRFPVASELPTFSELPGTPRIIERSQHIISRKNIDYDALQVMYRLIRNGYRTFMVGGAVRDLLLGIIPKDVDVATEASPEEVRRVFRNSRIIGRRFRLIHVFFKDHKTVEVSTFRRDASVDENVQCAMCNVQLGEGEAQEKSQEGPNASQQEKPPKKPIVGDDNTYGDPQTDALRRDITINGLFYDLSNFTVVDYVGGVEDLENKIIRIIGEPEKRFVEDPVRMMRVVRHAARTKFKIEKETYKALCENASRIALCPQSRVFEEFMREMKHCGTAESFKLMIDTGLLAFLFPALYKAVSNDKALYKKLEYTLKQISEMVAEGYELLPSVLFAALAIGIMHGEPKADDETDENYAGKIGLYQVWAESPFKEYYVGDDGQPVTKAPNIDFNKFMNRLKSGYLRSTTKEQFTALGVSKKECDRMEQILSLRILMFENFYGRTQTQGLENKRGFEATLHLLRLTARDKYAKDCLEYWTRKFKKL